MMMRRRARASRVLGENADRERPDAVCAPDDCLARHHPSPSGGRDRGQSPQAAPKIISAEESLSRIPAVQLCYVRLAVAQPQAAATFATEILGLQHVVNRRVLSAVQARCL